MANTSREATIKFNAETTEFNQNIKSANSTLSTLRGEMKLNEAQFKNTGDKTEYLQKKSELLKKELDANKEKQQALNEKLNKAKEIYGNDSEEVQKLTRQLNSAKVEEQNLISATDRCEQEMKELEQSVDGAGKELGELAEEADSAGDAAETSGDGWSALGQVLSDLATNAIQNIISGLKSAAEEAIKVGMSFESSMDNVQAISGATSDQMVQLSDKAKLMGRTTKFSATEVGDAFGYMGMAGWKTEDMLAGIDGVMQLAAASGTDLAKTSDIVTDGLTAFGLSAADTTMFADVLAKTSASANTNVEMMGETFKYAGPVCNTLGISIQDAALATGLMANSGIKASQAGTSLRGGLTRLVKPSKEVSTAMERYGIELQKNEDGSINLMATMEHMRNALGDLDEETQANAVAMLFGQNAMAGWSAIINASDDDFYDLASAIDNSSGSAREMANIMNDNLQGAVTSLNSATEGLGIAFFDKVSGPMTEGVRLATDLINGITDAITPTQTLLDRFLKDISASNEAVRQSIDNANSIMQNAENDTARMDAYKKILMDINEQGTNLTEFQKAELKMIVEELGPAIPGLTEAYDAEHGVLTVTNDELERMFGNQEQLIMQQAMMDAQVESVKAMTTAKLAQAQAESALSESVTELGDLMPNINSEQDAYNFYTQQIATGLTKLTPELDNAFRRFNESRQAVSLANEQYEEATKQHDELERAISEVSKDLESQKDDTKESAKAMKEMGDESAKAGKKTETAMENLEDTVDDAESSIDSATDAVVEDFEEISDEIGNADSEMSKFVRDTESSFANMKLKMPEIQLPRMPEFDLAIGTKTIDGKTYEFPSGVRTIAWHAKAMQNGMIMNGPTIFGYNPQTGQFMGGGEAGSETLVGTGSLLNMIQATVENSAASIDYDKMARKMTDAFESIDFGISVDGRKFGRLVRSVS